MYGFKVGWAGQTFALAKCNDSGGRKSRIRLSKKERKAMVETFIKKFQTTNNGNFPSLNLTHKEVGGSFYTVREIVREIIQENRVLGPAKFTLEQQNSDRFFEEYPLGSISMESHIHMASFGEPHNMTIPTTFIHEKETNEVLISDSSGLYEQQEQWNWKLEDGISVNGSTHAAEGKQKSSECCVQSDEPEMNVPKGEENVVYEISTSEAKIPQPSEAKIPQPRGVINNDSTHTSERKQEYSEVSWTETPVMKVHMEKEMQTSEVNMPQIIKNVTVETFPLRQVSDTIFTLDGDLGKSRATSEEKINENMGVEAVNNVLVPDTGDTLKISSILVEEKGVVKAESPVLDMNYSSVDDKTDQSVEIPNLYASESINLLEIKDDTTELDIKEIFPAETNHKSVQNGVGYLNDTVSSSFESQPIFAEVTDKRESDIHHGDSSQKASDPTLDRINLESWEKNMDRSNVGETNSLLVFVKAVISAFVKFWTE